MNHKLAFILPRAAALTLAVGIGALVLFVVFKLLIALLVVGMIVFAAKALTAAWRTEQLPGRHYTANSQIIPLEPTTRIMPVVVRTRPVIVPIG
ncbi:hypothetical protein GCM10023091_09960 [Ravibacter arvi]|uniref:Uncharacterized protein n=1 Tax=Ravibacter arvi TaxID=2051041 RepID=A0ABP8LT76_9BACT